MDIAIIGAGIGGLTTALFLEKMGHFVHIYEQAKEIKPVGAGIILAHNAMQVYDKLGLKNDIARLGNPLSSINITTSKFEVISKTEMAYFDKKYSVKNIAILRSELQILLSNKLKAHININKILIDVNESGFLLFSDKTSVQHDIVIAADGINSVVRDKLFFGSIIRKANQTCWRGISNINLPPKLRYELNELWGDGNRFGFVKISTEKVYWYAVHNSEEKYSEIDLAGIFSEYDPLVNDIISKTNLNELIKNNIQDLKPIDCWVKGNVCLIGDAAHATTPNMGQGACQAIEDAYVLSHCLNHYPVNTAFKKYECLRIKKAKSIVNMSWTLGRVSQLKNPNILKLRNFFMKLTPERLNKKHSERIFELTKMNFESI